MISQGLQSRSWHSFIITDFDSKFILFAGCSLINVYFHSVIFLSVIMTSVDFRLPSTVQLVIFCCLLNVGAENVEIVTPQNSKIDTKERANVTAGSDDSYVRAYEEVQKLRLGTVAKRNDYFEPPEKDKEGSYNTVIHSSYVSDEKYPSLTHHWMPTLATSPPLEVYGPPHSHHHHHKVVPPTHSCHAIPYSSPSNFYLGFLPKKLSLKILLKILLKLVLFKMIVKFIAVICLLLFVPTLKSKETSMENDSDERKKSREFELVSNMIWNSIEDKNFLYKEEEEMDVKELAEQLDDEEEEEEENVFSGPLKAVRFLEFCVSAVDRVVGYVLGVLKRQRNEEQDLSSFVLEKLDSFVSQSLKLLDVRVPQIIDVRDEAVLKCKFDLGGDELYSIKWYKEELEFFRYMPDNSPKIQTFPVDGVHVVESKSNATVITLSPLEYRSSGVYRCEVSSERPHFKTVYKSENMSVLGLPRGGPTIEGIKDTYFLGDYVTGNCTSSPSNPGAQIQWYINEKKAEDWFLEYYNPPKRKEEFNLESRVLGLRFQVDLTHYQGKNQVLSLTCQSTVAGKTKTQRVKVHLSRMMTNQKFAQEQVNAGRNGRGPQTFVVLLGSFLCFFLHESPSLLLSLVITIN